VRARLLCILVLLAGASLPAGCGAAMHRSSPWEYGFSIRPAPGFPVGSGQVTLHPTVSYTYLSFEGGKDELFEIGGQVRRPLGGFWVGAEVAAARLRTSFDEELIDSYSTNGWSATALAGVPVTDSKWGINLYAGGGISHYGSTGMNLRAGVDLQPWFLRR
jgi:hypothetical protein